MAQSDLIGAVPASSGLNVRVNLNTADQALASESEGGSAPTRTYPHMPWRDHASGIRYRRNSANTAWLVDEVYAGTTDPGVDDDEAAGFSIGVRWINATAGRVFVCTDPSEGAAVWQALGRAASRAKAPPEIANNVADAANNIDVAAGSCLSDEGVPLTLAASITKRLDAAWAAGTSNGGLDTGSMANSTWYSVWLIGKADGTVDAMGSTEASAPTMPSGYVYKRRLGWVRNDASGNILPFKQQGDLYLLGAIAADATDVQPPTGGTAVTVTAPPNTLARMSAEIYHASASPAVLLIPTAIPSVAPTAGGAFTLAASAGAAVTAQLDVLTDASSQIHWRVSGTVTRLWLRTHGWIDRRGRDQ